MSAPLVTLDFATRDLVCCERECKATIAKRSTVGVVASRDDSVAVFVCYECANKIVQRHRAAIDARDAETRDGAA